MEKNEKGARHIFLVLEPHGWGREERGANKSLPFFLFA